MRNQGEKVAIFHFFSVHETDKISRALAGSCLIVVLSVLYMMLGCSKKSTQPEKPAEALTIEQKRAKVLTYIQSLPAKSSNRVLVGQHVSSVRWIVQGYSDYIESLIPVTGDAPALMGVDLSGLNDLDWAMTKNRILDHWNKGGLVTIGWHMANPWTGGDSWDTNEADLTELLRDNSVVALSTWRPMIDQAATALKSLEDAGVIVLFRPFHEMNGGWFWWGRDAHPGDADPFIKLWQWLYDTLTETKSLGNLIWVYSANRATGSGGVEPVSFYYPGTDYADIVGVDVYYDTIYIPSYAELSALGKPMAVTEFGPGTPHTGGGDYDNTRSIQVIRENYPEIIYWLHWTDWDGADGTRVKKSIVNNLNAKALFEDPWVVTRSEVDWR